MTLFEIIYEDWVNHGKDWSKPGFRAIAAHRLGRWLLLQPKSKVIIFFLGPVYLYLYRLSRNSYGIELPWGVRVGRNVVIEHQGAIVIHGGCVIGNGCTIRQGVTLGNRYMDRPTEAPVLGDGVNVGAGAKILGKVIIGNFANIGANAVVIKDVLAGESVGGVPAKSLGINKQYAEETPSFTGEWFDIPS